MTICVDPGHGGKDAGATGGDCEEKDLALGIAHRAATILMNMQANVAMTRTRDRYVTLEDRADLANEEDADTFVSIHLNSFPEPVMSAGTSVYHYPGSKRGKALAERIIGKFRSKSPLDVRGVKQSDEEIDEDANPYLYVLSRTSMPAVLVETGFISQSTDRAWLSSNAGMHECALWVADGLLEEVDAW